MGLLTGCVNKPQGSGALGPLLQRRLPSLSGNMLLKEKTCSLQKRRFGEDPELQDQPKK